MGLFLSNQKATRYGVIIDVGSGSVLIAIVASDPSQDNPEIIWSKREYIPFRKTDEMSVGAKSIMTSIMNVMMLLDSEGRKALFEKVGDQELEHIQVTLTAPWSYTVTKTISYQQDEEFLLSTTLVSELLETAQKKVDEELRENEQMYDLGLSLVSRTTTEIMANGYSAKLTAKQKAKTLKLFQSNVIAQTKILETLQESRSKILPKSELTVNSFMLPFFYVTKDLFPTAENFCLIDVTYEATEIGVVRDGVLKYCTHAPYGSLSIAREIAAVISVPIEEAYGYLSKANIDHLLVKHSDTQRKEIEVIYEEYRKRLVGLFGETGDSLSIPKKIFLHVNTKTEPFFKKQITEASKMATNSSHAVYSLSDKILTAHYPKKAQENIRNSKSDTALLLSAQFFHNKDYHLKFEQL